MLWLPIGLCTSLLARIPASSPAAKAALSRRCRMLDALNSSAISGLVDQRLLFRYYRLAKSARRGSALLRWRQLLTVVSYRRMFFIPLAEQTRLMTCANPEDIVPEEFSRRISETWLRQRPEDALFRSVYLSMILRSPALLDTPAGAALSCTEGISAQRIIARVTRARLR